MFSELLKMPIDYDMGIDIRTTRARKKHRKGVNKRCDNKEVIQMTSKEFAEITGEVMTKLLRGRP